MSLLLLRAAQDPKVYDPVDSFGHIVEPYETAPLRMWGSLRQFRDTATIPGAGFPEDIVEDTTPIIQTTFTTQKEEDALALLRASRSEFSFYANYRDRI